MGGLPLLRSHLYAPGNNPRLLEKVYQAGADAVVLDLEDAVPPAEKARARELVAATVGHRAGRGGPPTFVRINHPATGLAADDVRAIVRPGLAGIRIPKVEDAETVREVAAWIAPAEAAAGMAAGSIVLVPLIESGAGIFQAVAVARADPRVLSLAYGEADLTRDLGLTPGPDGLETLCLRSQLVLASRIAGVRPPIDSVATRLDDLEGLRQTTRQGKALGFFGRSAIHPKQVPIINGTYTPTSEEIAQAQAVVAGAEAAAARGTGALRLASGEFVDAAIVRRARSVLDLAEKFALETGLGAEAAIVTVTQRTAGGESQ